MKKIIAFLIGFLLLLSVWGFAGAEGEPGCMPPEPTYTPDMPEYHDQAGGRAYTQGEYEDAIASYRTALALDPRYGHGYYGLAFTYRAMGRLDLALENYAKAAELIPGYAQPYAARGQIHQFLGRTAQAQADFDRYVELEGQYPVPYVARGDFYLENGEYRRAIDDYTIAFEKGLAQSAQAEVYLNRAQAWLSLGEYDQAAADFQAAVQAAQPEQSDGLAALSPYDEAEVVPGAQPYAFDGFETYVVIIGAYPLEAEGRDPAQTEAQLESIRRAQDAYFALSDFYFGYAPESIENGNEIIALVNQVVPMLEVYEVSYFDSGDVSEYELWEVIADAWYHFDPEGAASEDMAPTVEMVEFVLYQ